MLDERKRKVSELVANGETIMNVSKIVGVSRNTIYDWLKDDELQAEVDRLIGEFKKHAERKIDSKCDLYLGELEKLALTSKSEKIRLEATTYLINRIYGTPTTKTQDITENKEGINKVIDLDTIKNAIVNVEKKEIVEAEIVQDTDNNPADNNKTE